MLRIPNPGSDLPFFIRIFRELYEDLQHLPQFGLDDMGKAMSQRKSVASQGAIGAEALKRSTRADRSRDPIFNQVKMYSELFRVLGWLQLVAGAQTFTFSPLGREVATRSDPTLLVRESLLGIAYPNELVGVLAGSSVRIFATVLYTMERLGGTITREEIIAGPMHLSDDRDQMLFDSMVRFLEECREHPGRLKAFFATLERDQGIQQTTRENYTRFVIGALRWSGWVAKVSQHLELTAAGRAQIAALRRLSDLRVTDIEKVLAKDPLMRVAYGDMLERGGLSSTISGFDRTADEAAIPKALSRGRLLFSPFQQFGAAKLAAAFGVVTTSRAATSRSRPAPAVAEGEGPYRVREVKTKRTGALKLSSPEVRELAAQLGSVLDANRGDVGAAADAFASMCRTAGRDTFYKLVANLFCILGYRCEASRAGVNYLRADAMIEDPTASVPIEIKSPAEELLLSVKAVRQALENKIVLLARRGYPTTREATSLAVGFEAPNDRSDIHDLIEDIHKTFEINVAVLDLRSLVRLALRALQGRESIEVLDLRQSRGILHAA